MIQDLLSVPTEENINKRIKLIVWTLIATIVVMTILSLGNSNKFVMTLIHLFAIVVAGYAIFNISYFK